jgi:hypothetical protein
VDEPATRRHHGLTLLENMMLYTRPRMSAVFYIVGLLGILSAVVGLLIAIAMYFETQGVTKDDVKDAFIVTVATGLGSLLLLGLASILNVLHDVRAEVARAAAIALAQAGPAGTQALARFADQRLADRPRLYVEEA